MIIGTERGHMMSPAGKFVAVVLMVLALVVETSGRFANAATVQELLEQADRLANDDDRFPDSLERAIVLYEQAGVVDPQNPLPYLRIASACLELGNGLEDGRLPWYERGVWAAERAVVLKEDNADAHFYLAANRGRLVEHVPFWKVSPTVPADLEQHVLRALTLDPHHARALNMMGMLPNAVPGPLRLFMEGKKEQVEDYLKRAVEADPHYAQLRWDLAEFYRAAGRQALAREQAQEILTLSNPTDRRAWAKKFRPQAETLLKTLSSP